MSLRADHVEAARLQVSCQLRPTEGNPRDAQTAVPGVGLRDFDIEPSELPVFARDAEGCVVSRGAHPKRDQGLGLVGLAYASRQKRSEGQSESQR